MLSTLCASFATTVNNLGLYIFFQVTYAEIAGFIILKLVPLYGALQVTSSRELLLNGCPVEMLPFYGL